MAETKGAGARAANGGAKEPPMRIDPKLVRDLAQLLTDNELTEIEVQDGDRRIKVCRNPAPIIGTTGAAPAAAAAAPISAAASEAPASPKADETGNAIKSPMVGTAFMSPEPGGKPFIAVGDAVKAGDTLLIVEAMKVMNPITAPSAGVVKKVMVADGQPVEFDQPLVILG